MMMTGKLHEWDLQKFKIEKDWVVFPIHRNTIVSLWTSIHFQKDLSAFEKRKRRLTNNQTWSMLLSFVKESRVGNSRKARKLIISIVLLNSWQQASKCSPTSPLVKNLEEWSTIEQSPTDCIKERVEKDDLKRSSSNLMTRTIHLTWTNLSTCLASSS